MTDVTDILIPFINARHDQAADKVRLMIPNAPAGDGFPGAALVFDTWEDAQRAVAQMGQVLLELAERRRWNDRPEPAPEESPVRRRLEVVRDETT